MSQPFPDPFDFAMRNAKKVAVKYVRMPGIHIIVRRERCIGCKKCVRQGFCRFGAISVSDKKAKIDDRRCRGCMRCTHLCPSAALAIEARPPQLIQDGLRKVDDEVSRRI